MTIQEAWDEFEELREEWSRRGTTQEAHTMKYKVIEDQLCQLDGGPDPDNVATLRRELRHQGRLEWHNLCIPISINEWLQS